jgi:hypothetical protein
MTPGPDAVLGPAIEVGLPRPRRRRHMSLEPAYQKARRALVEFLRFSVSERETATSEGGLRQMRAGSVARGPSTEV